jgi:hypothetical protein
MTYPLRIHRLHGTVTPIPTLNLGAEVRSIPREGGIPVVIISMA